MHQQYTAVKALPLVYNLFTYRQELAHSKSNALQLTTKKIEITSQLIAASATKIWHASGEDIAAFTRQMAFKESLLQQQWVLSGGLSRLIEADNFVRNYEWSDFNEQILEDIDIGAPLSKKCAESEVMGINERDWEDADYTEMDVDVVDVQNFKFECDWASLLNSDANTKEGYETHCQVHWFDELNMDIDMSV